MSIRVDEKGRAHVEPRIVRGPIAAIGLVLFIGVMCVVATFIHRDNLRAREQARQAAEAAEAAAAGAPGGR